MQILNRESPDLPLQMCSLVNIITFLCLCTTSFKIINVRTEKSPDQIASPSYRPLPANMLLRGICGQRKPRSACASTQSGLGVADRLQKALNIIQSLTIDVVFSGKYHIISNGYIVNKWLIISEKKYIKFPKSLILETNKHGSARSSQCISQSMDWVEGGFEPMKNLFITYNNVLYCINR